MAKVRFEKRRGGCDLVMYITALDVLDLPFLKIFPFPLSFDALQPGHSEDREGQGVGVSLASLFLLALEGSTPECHRMESW